MMRPVCPRQKSDMFKTGNNFIDACLTVVRFLPLLPVLLMLIKKGYC